MTPSPVLLAPGGQRILFVLAHPDDADFLCGGTIALLAAEGKDLHYLLVTRGDKGSDEPEMTPERLANLREQEQRNAALALGVQHLTFLDGYYDSEVEPTLQLRAEIALLIRQWKPDTVFTFDPWKRNEVHPDHRAVGICTLDALACARGSMNFPGQLRNGLTPHAVRDIYYFSTDQPNHWVDISSVVEQKIAAGKCHISQTRTMDLENWIYRRGSIAGAAHKFQFAETFHHYAL